MTNKNFKDSKEYTDDKEGGKRREYKKKYHHKRSKKEPMTKGEIKDDIDSDGFEVVGSKEDKKQKYRDEHRGEFVPKRGRGRGNWKRGAQWKRKDHDNEKKEKKEKEEENEEKEGEEEIEEEKEEKEEKKEEKKEKKEEKKKWDKKDKKDKKKDEKKKEKTKENEQPKKLVIVSSGKAKCLKDLIG